MTIVVVFNGSRFFIEPNPAVVASGSPLDWLLYYDGHQTLRIRWTLSFPSGSPFKATMLSAIASAPPLTVPRPSEAKIDAGLPMTDGCYKYDVEVEDASTGNKLGKDDPYLIVRP
jgi:hypothetical protein